MRELYYDTDGGLIGGDESVEDMEKSVARRRRGRPKKENPNDVRFDAWISSNEQAMLEEMLMSSDKSKSELTRRMIRHYYFYYQGRW